MKHFDLNKEKLIRFILKNSKEYKECDLINLTIESLILIKIFVEDKMAKLGVSE